MSIRKKTLYDVLEVSRTATTEVITSAYETRRRLLANSSAPEVLAEKELLRDAHAILADATRRKLYDNKLRDEALRAMTGEEGLPRATSSSTAEVAEESSGRGWLIAVMLAVVALAGSWIYLEHKRAAERIRQEEVQRVEQARRQEEDAKRRQEQVEWAKAEYEKRQQEIDMQRAEAQRRRDQAQFQNQQSQYARQQAMQDQQRAMEQRRAEADRQRQEQENLRRSQMQLQREQRLLREIESNRGMKF